MRRASRARGWATAIVSLPLAAVGCADNRQSTLDPASDASREIADLWWILFVVSAVVFAIVLALVVFVALRRSAPTPEPDRRPSRLGTALILVAGIAVPTVVLVVLFGLSVATLPAVSAGERGGELEIEVRGNQWFWDVRYPDADVRTANEIHIPVGTPVEVAVTTEDVIHSFWVPELQRKIDLIPGERNSIVLEADAAGVYRGQCAEYCGLQHANMAFLVVAEEREEFERWLARQSEAADEPAGALAERGSEVFMDAGCGGCHRVAGTEADGDVGPDLTHVALRRTLAAGTVPNRRGYLGGWILDPQAMKPGAKMPGTNLSGDDLQALLDYLEGLD